MQSDSLLDRFLRYIAIDTTSNEAANEQPSSAGQLTLASLLVDELRALGVSASLSPFGYVYANIPASPGLEAVPPLGFLAHLDTSSAASGANIKPQIICSYDGSVIPLGSSSLALDPSQFPVLKRCLGKTLITTDGSTLLGADDKAGVAILMSLIESLDTFPHGPVSIAFTPDEEIGRGTEHFDPDLFAASYAYTLDGGAPNEFECANFNAAVATFTFHGISVHPGQAKGVMRNAIKLAAEALAALPAKECPEQTSGREGFYHPVSLSGDVSLASLTLLIRDHSDTNFATRQDELRHIEKDLNAAYGAGTVELSVSEQYRNMETAIKRVPFMVTLALKALEESGLSPQIVPTRGGTDGAMLTTRLNIPCPNLGTGGYNYHGPYEFAVLEEMQTMLRVCQSLLTLWTKSPPR